MPEIDEISLPAALAALRGSGFAPTVGDAPARRWTDEPRQAAWVQAAGGDGFAAVAVDTLVPDRRPGMWLTANRRTGAGTVTGYHASFQTGESSYGSAAEFCSVFVDDVVAAVRDWCDWERTWSVHPAAEPPAKRIARLRRLAASKLATSSVPVDVDIDPLMLGLLDAAEVDHMQATVADLFDPGIRWHFPRDKTGGKLATRAQVLLRQCAPPAHPAGKGVWLVVDGPLPRTEPRLTVRLARAVGKSMPHRWDAMPEYWRSGPRTVEQQWGIIDRTPPAMVAEVTDLLLAARMLDALTLCGVDTDRRTGRMLTGLPVQFRLREWTDKWVTNATDLLMNAAPWRWREAVAPKRRPQRLATLGGFGASMRPGLFLECRADRPYLSFEQSGSPLMLPRVTWERDLDYDLIRAGLLTRDQVPTSGT